MNGSSYPMVKTMNGIPIGDNCVMCDAIIGLDRWLCCHCNAVIGRENINNALASMPEYLHNSQCEKWLKLKLSEYK